MFPGGIGYVKRQKIINRLVANDGFQRTAAEREVADLISRIIFDIRGS